MALDKNTLIVDIKAILVAANAASGSKDAVFQTYAEDLADAIDKFVKTGSVVNVQSGGSTISVT